MHVSAICSQILKRLSCIRHTDPCRCFCRCFFFFVPFALGKDSFLYFLFCFMTAGEHCLCTISNGHADIIMSVCPFPDDRHKQIISCHFSGIQADMLYRGSIPFVHQYSTNCSCKSSGCYLSHLYAFSPSSFTVSSITSRSRK